VGLVVQNANGAAFDTFIKFGEIKGEGSLTDKVHTEWCIGGTFSFGVDHPVPLGGGGGGTSSATPAPFLVTKLIDRASPELFLDCAMGTTIPTVTLEMVRSTGGSVPQTFYKIVLSNVTVNNVGTSSAVDGAVVPTETLKLGYEKISITYWIQNPNTGVLTQQPEVTWNFLENNK
jgi:type VI secretion system Hcp family effector